MATPKFYVKASSYSNINPYPTWKRDADYWEKDISNNLFYMSGNIGIGYPIPAGGLVVTTTIGIGTSAPQAALDVSGNVYLRDGTATAPILTFNTDTNTGFYRPGNDTLGFVTGGSERMRIDASGNMGIGTITPRAKFDVNDTGAMIISAGTTAQLPSTPILGMLRFNITTNRLQFYNASGWSSLGGVSAIGGNQIYEINGYRVHVFTSAGDFTVLNGGEMEYLIVAGGGGGGRRIGGGGGGGGILFGTRTILTSISKITIGNGGDGSALDNFRGGNGGNTTFFDGTVTLTALGGGGGGSYSQAASSSPGGSGGGGTHGEVSTSTLGGIGGVQGNNGGNGGPGNNPYVAGGGGGYSQPGEASISTKAGDGGNGYNGISSFGSGVGHNGWFGGGGGGAWWSPTIIFTRAATGGQGGGGTGTAATGNNSQISNPGLINTGGGGGGGGWTGSVGIPGGNGGSGIVIIRYLL